MKKLLTLLLTIGLCLPVIAGATLWSYYSEQGLNLPSITQRAEIAKDIGIEDYRGTEGQNNALEAYLRGNIGLGAYIPDISALFETSLQNSITSSATTLTLVSGDLANGDTLSGTYGFIIDEGSSNEEFVLCTCTDTACTACRRGIDPVDGYTEVSDLQYSHRRGASVKITDFPLLGLMRQVLTGATTTPGILQYASSTSIGVMGNNTLATKSYVDNVGAGGFTAGNIGTGLTLRANGTSPETMDVNTSTQKWFEIRDSKFVISSTTDSMLYGFWSDRYNATSTKYGDFTFEDNLTVGGNATTTGSIYAGEFCDSTGCSSSVGGSKLLYATSTNMSFTGTATTTIASFTIPANSLINTNQIIGSIPVYTLGSNDSFVNFEVSLDSTVIVSAYNMRYQNASGTIDIIVGAKGSSSSQVNTLRIPPDSIYVGKDSVLYPVYHTAESSVDMTSARTLYFKMAVQDTDISFKYNNAWFELKR